MTRVPRLTYATYVQMRIENYGYIHGIIEEFGGRVKQFSQDINSPTTWYLFFEIPKTQKTEFDNIMKEKDFMSIIPK